LPVLLNLNSLSIVKSPLSPSSVQIWMLPLNSSLTEVRNSLNCLNKSSMFLFQLKSRFASSTPE
jgi:hypothetical protein